MARAVCKSCGHDLTASANGRRLGVRCPECGAEDAVVRRARADHDGGCAAWGLLVAGWALLLPAVWLLQEVSNRNLELLKLISVMAGLAVGGFVGAVRRMRSGADMLAWVSLAMGSVFVLTLVGLFLTLGR